MGCVYMGCVYKYIHIYLYVIYIYIIHMGYGVCFCGYGGYMVWGGYD